MSKLIVTVAPTSNFAGFDAATLSILLGGNVRVGFEDNIYTEKGKLASSNAEIVRKIVRIARELGLEIATPAENRSRLMGVPFCLPRCCPHSLKQPSE